MTKTTNETLDQRVAEMVKKLKDLETTIEAKEKATQPVSWKTSAMSTSTYFKTIQVATKEQVISFITHLYAQAAPRAEVAKLLGIEKDSSIQKFEGSTFEDWVTDAKLRLKLIEIHGLRQKLVEGRRRVESLKSEVQKRADGIDDLENFLE